jgi:hypothetical protein
VVDFGKDLGEVALTVSEPEIRDSLTSDLLPGQETPSFMVYQGSVQDEINSAYR